MLKSLHGNPLFLPWDGVDGLHGVFDYHASLLLSPYQYDGGLLLLVQSSASEGSCKI